MRPFHPGGVNIMAPSRVASFSTTGIDPFAEIIPCKLYLGIVKTENWYSSCAESDGCGFCALRAAPASVRPLIQGGEAPSPIQLRDVTDKPASPSSIPTAVRDGVTSSRPSPRVWRRLITMATATSTSTSSMALRCRAPGQFQRLETRSTGTTAAGNSPTSPNRPASVTPVTV